MGIAIIGGTGDLGEGLIKRLSLKNQVIVGSRVKDKAQTIAAQLSRQVEEVTGVKPDLQGDENAKAVSQAEISILAVPHEYAVQTVQGLAESFRRDSVLITPVVPMVKVQNCFQYSPPTSMGFKSMAQQIAKLVSVPVVAAFHSLPAKKLADLSVELELDVPICGDSQRALEKTMDLIQGVPNLRPLIVGGLETAYMVESLTPLILNVAMKNKMRNLSLKFV
jgi:NADPH-dependent F420 reductase